MEKKEAKNNIVKLKKQIQKGIIDIDYFSNEHWPSFSNEERQQLLESCGPSCFLIYPSSTSKNISIEDYKFPICRLSTVFQNDEKIIKKKQKKGEEDKRCKIDAYGLLSARRRAILTQQYPKLVEDLTKLISDFHITQKSRNITSFLKKYKYLTPSFVNSIVLLDFSSYYESLYGPSEKIDDDSFSYLCWIQSIPTFSKEETNHSFTFYIAKKEVPHSFLLEKKKKYFSPLVHLTIPSFHLFKQIQILHILLMKKIE